MGMALRIDAETGAEELVEVPDLAPVVPATITQRQARIVLALHGLLQAAEDAIAALPGTDGDVARIEWQYASEFRRDHPLIIAIGTSLGLTEQQIDALFIEAGSI